MSGGEAVGVGLGRVWLVGAGCGSADLITLRGMAVLRRCQAVVYDDLIDRELLSFAPAEAERICVGKRGGLPSAAQEEICAVLIRLAREGREVVRLKGGDPFVFGRGGEEMTALGEAGIPCEEIPGVTSAIAIPAAAGIPVTDRRFSRSLHILTARTAGPDGLPEDLDRLARLEGTLVFLMGLGQLPRIVRRLILAGRDPQTPAAVISGGCALHPAAVRAPLCRLPEQVREASVQAPAVIVVGQTAALELRSTISHPLAGRRVGLVGTPAILRRLQGPLRELGARTFRAQTLEVRPLPCSLEGLAERRPWLAFTSVNGVECFFRALAERGLDIRTLAGCRIAAVGKATEAALWDRGIQTELRPRQASTAALGEALAERCALGEAVWLLRSARADGALRRRLEGAGLSVRDLRLYDVSPRREERAVRAAELAEADHLVFASAGGVCSFLEEFGALPARPVCVCIGEVTAAALRRRTNRPFLTAAEPSAEGILEAILAHAAGASPEEDP